MLKVGIRRPSRVTGDRRLLQATALVSTLDRFAMPPMLIAIARDLDAPLARIVQAASVYFLAYGLMQPVWGLISDRVGLVRTMRFALLIAGLATAVSALVAGPLSLALARGVAGGTFSAGIPAGLVYLGDTVPPADRQREITNLMSGSAIGTALGASGAGIVAQLASWRVTFLITSVFAFVLVLGLRWLTPPPRDRQGQRLGAALGQVARSRWALLVLLLAFGDGVVLLGVLTLLPAAVEAAGTGAALSGSVTAFYGLGMLVFARVAGSLSRRLGRWQLPSLGALAAFVGCALVAVTQTPVAAIVVALLLGLAWAWLHSTLQTWVTEVLPAVRATVVSLFAGALFTGSAVAALLASGPAGRGEYGSVFAVATVLIVPVGVAAGIGRARWRPPGGQESYRSTSAE
ncbi:MFS transporter [Cryptosporangium arvum]|uniref:Arabinose efflux permease family protein n=1 Tax=Cryptosporangium arvum DSM 44712 TaxID=927661 RepID=A0A010ZW43_9ACTN|nr:MFS transporter [Cryptosporangium arvum]EXG81437.1 arabinose efflux permease family protein [Cryptosporangium arvum DSM 44712]